MAGRLEELLRCELPIQLAPMGSVSATPRLALAVAAAGGHAMFPALNLPAPALGAVLDELKAAAPAYGVNFLVPLMRPEALDTALEQAPYLDFFLADPDPALVDAVHRAGAVCGWQIETAAEAEQAEAAGCDVLVLKGAESGGRKRVDGPGLLPLIDAVAETSQLPLIAAGGIATARGAAAAMAAGADGVRVGTRFIAATESDAHPVWVRAILDASAEDAVVSTAFNTGMPVAGPHRVLRSAIDAATALTSDQAGVIPFGDAELPVPRFGPQAPTRGAVGAVEAMALYAGQSAGAVRDVRPAAEIVGELAQGVSSRA